MRGFLESFVFACEKPVQLFDKCREFLVVLLMLNLSAQFVHSLSFVRGREFPSLSERTIIADVSEQNYAKLRQTPCGFGDLERKGSTLLLGSVATRRAIGTSTQFQNPTVKQGS